MSYDLPSFPPNDFAPDDYDDVEDGMRVSVMVIIALMSGALGLGMGWLIWS